MQASQAGELGLLQPRDHAEDPDLLGVGQLGLEPDHAVHRFFPVFRTELKHRDGLLAGFRVHQPDRFHTAERESLNALGGEDLDRLTAAEHQVLFEFPVGNLLGVPDFVDEPFVLLAGERAIKVIVASLSIARGGKDPVVIDGVGVDDGGGGVVKVEVPLPDQPPDGLREGLGGQGPGGDDDKPARGQFGHLAADQSNPGKPGDFPGDGPGKPDPVDGEGSPGGDPVLVRRPEDQRSVLPHLLLEQSHGVFRGIRPEGVGAYQLGQVLVVMGRRKPPGLHFVQRGGEPRPADLVGRLASGQTAADDVNFVFHGIARDGGAFN